jgi:hypothetical protein
MVKKNNESDFYGLESIGYGRLSPDGISAFFWATFVFSFIITLVVFFAIGTSPVVPLNWSLAMGFDLLAIIFHLLVALLFTSMKIAFKFQRIQAFILLFISIKLSVEFYQIFYLMCMDRNTPDLLTDIGTYLLFGGFVYLILSTVRAFWRVHKGEFRKGGKLLYDFQTSKVHISLPILFFVVMMGTAIAKHLPFMIEIYFVLLLAVVIQYAIAMAWPEFLLLTYCKFRFQSFRILPPEKRSGKVRKV